MKGLSTEEKQARALFDHRLIQIWLVKKRYNQLAKSLHPDHNRDDPKAEEKLKEINLAYSVLRKNAMKEKNLALHKLFSFLFAFPLIG